MSLQPIRVGYVQEEFFTTEYCCPTDSLEFHGGKDDFCTKTPWYANRRFDVYSVVNSYFQAPDKPIVLLTFLV